MYHWGSFYSVCKSAGMFASVWIHLRAECVCLCSCGSQSVSQSVFFPPSFFWPALQPLHLHTHQAHRPFLSVSLIAIISAQWPNNVIYLFHPSPIDTPPPHSLHPCNNQPINICQNLTTVSNWDQVKEAVHMHFTHIKRKINTKHT